MPEPPANFSLDSLLTDREDCLATAGEPDLVDAKLVGAQIEFDTDNFARISYEGDDLLATKQFHTALDNLSAKHAHVVQVQLDFYLAGAPEPCHVRLKGPNTVEVSDAGFTERFFGWLTKSLFCKLARSTAAKLLLVLGLTLAAASSSCPGPDTDNDDSPDDPEHTHSLSVH